MHIRIAPPLALHELGRRQNQEDALWPPLGAASAADRLFLVCDGMGGHDHGEVASQTVTEAIGSYIARRLPADQPLADSLLADAIADAYEQLDRRDNPGDQKKMGTTLTLLCLHRAGATMAHIGDSRIYHVRPSEHRILYQSRDHSLVMELYLAGELTRGQMATYEGRNVITRAMQPHQERRSRPDIVHSTDLRPGDLFLLCSDGVLERLTDAQLLGILCAELPDEERLQRLRTATADAADNHTAYLVRVLDVKPEADDAAAPHDEDSSRANLLIVAQERENEAEPTTSDGHNASGWWQKLMHGILKNILLLVCLLALSAQAQDAVVRRSAKPATPTSKPTAKPSKPKPRAKPTNPIGEVIYETFSANGVSFKMIHVEGGTFTMGATSEQGSDAESDEKPAHQVTLSSYSIGETEVTQALWQAVMGSNPSYFKGSDRPVEQVSWDDCQKFISKLNALTGKTFRLPTEAEWEYAARGGKKSQGYKYSGSNSLDNVAWYGDNSGDETHLVKTKSPNEIGLYDMSGNVWEWCQDWYGDYRASAQTSPTRPRQTAVLRRGDYRASAQTNPTGSSSGFYRVYRGGSWDYYAMNCRVSFRHRLTPDVRCNYLGFRLAL